MKGRGVSEHSSVWRFSSDQSPKHGHIWLSGLFPKAGKHKNVKENGLLDNFWCLGGNWGPFWTFQGVAEAELEKNLERTFKILFSRGSEKVSRRNTTNKNSPSPPQS